MRKYLPILVCLFFATNIFAQDIKNSKPKETITAEYSRVSITPLLINAGNQRVSDLFSRILIDDKFFDHKLSYDQVNLSGDELKNMTNGSKVSSDIVAKWYSRNNQGNFSMKLFEDRGLYNANDAMVLADKAAAVSRIKDLGEKLINKSYILFFDVRSVEKLRTETQEGYKATIKTYVYKIDWNDSIAAIFYNNLWIQENDPDAANKIEQFDNTKFPMLLVTTLDADKTTSQNIDHKKNLINRTDEELFEGAVLGAVGKIYFKAENDIEDFKVKTTLYGVKPLVAKIGKKEGLSVDQRYFVYEFQIDKNNNKKAKKKGVVRATNKIADNRTVNTGQSPTSKFYQVAGKKLQPGMLLRQKNDFGIGISLGGGLFMGDSKMFVHVGLDYNVSKLFKGKFPPGVKLFVNADFLKYNYNYFNTLNTTWGTNWSDDYFVSYGLTKEVTISHIELNLGLSKDYCFARNFCFTPFIAYHYALVSLAKKTVLVDNSNYVITVDPNKDPYKKDNIATIQGVNFGANLSMNIVHNFKIYVSGSYTYKYSTKIGDAYSGLIIPEEVIKAKSGLYVSAGLKLSL